MKNTSVWDRYPDRLSEIERRRLVSASVNVLLEYGDSELGDDYLSRSERGAADDIAVSLQEMDSGIDPDRLRHALIEWSKTEESSSFVLDLIHNNPTVARAVAEEYAVEERQMDLVAPALVLVLLIIALRVKKIDFKNGEITFFQGSPALVRSLLALLRNWTEGGQ